MKDLSKAKEKLFGKAFAQNKDRDVITDLYDKSGEMFRDSFLGKLSKKAITSDFTKTQRDKLLDKLDIMQGYPFKEKTILSPKYSEMVKAAKKEAELTGDDSAYQALEFGDAGMIPNPAYNPDSTLLSTYASSKPTKYTLGHVQFKPNEAGGYTLTDTYKVDPNESFGHEKYKPLRGYQSDIREGGRLAARLYDLSKFLGVNQPMKYNVEFGADVG